MKVNYGRCLAIQAEIAAINACDLADLQIYENAVLVDMPQNLIDDWKYVGLSNFAFIEMRGWEGVDISEDRPTGKAV